MLHVISEYYSFDECFLSAISGTVQHVIYVEFAECSVPLMRFFLIYLVSMLKL